MMPVVSGITALGLTWRNGELAANAERELELNLQARWRVARVQEIITPPRERCRVLEQKTAHPAALEITALEFVSKRQG